MKSPGWMAVPDDNEDEAMKVNSQARSMSATAWWLLVSSAVLAVLMHGEAPWWLIAIVAAEAYSSLRRVLIRMGKGTAALPPDSVETPTRLRRLRHFTSVKLAEGAPVDEIVARFLAFDSLGSVRSIELGSNSSSEQRSRGHSLGMLVTFAGLSQRNSFLNSPERAAFNAFLKPFVAEWFVFDMESGVVG